MATSRNPSEPTCRALERAAPLPLDRDLERSSALPERLVRVENASSGCRTHTADETSVSHRSGPGLQATHSLLSYETTWITMLQSCLSD
jgi:hypothetical protein